MDRSGTAVPRQPRYVLVTGCSSGIGAACALELADRGYQVLAGVRSAGTGDELARRSTGRIRPVLLDVTLGESIRQAVVEVAAIVGERGLHGLVNNAGVVVAGPLEHVTSDDLRRQFEVNLFGSHAVASAFLPLLRQAHGRLVNIGSISGRVPFPFLGAYAASKAALASLTATLRMELHRAGVQACVIEPGSVATPLWAKSRREAGLLIETLPDEAQEAYGPGMAAAFAASAKAAEIGVSAARVARVAARALEARRLRWRYAVGWDARLLAAARRYLPAALLEKIVLAVSTSSRWSRGARGVAEKSRSVL